MFSIAMSRDSADQVKALKRPGNLRRSGALHKAARRSRALHKAARPQKNYNNYCGISDLILL